MGLGVLVEGPADGASDAAPRLAAESLGPPLPAGMRPSISADGRWVVFEATAAGADRVSVFRTELTTGRTSELVPLPAEVRSGNTVRPVISADGCVVVANTELALDVFRDDDRGTRWDVYRLTVPECGGVEGDWELVSADVDTGTARDDVLPDSSPAVSASGAVVAYAHPYSDVFGDVSTISVVDLTVAPGSPVRSVVVAGTPTEPPTTAYRYRGARHPSVSADGRHVAFQADFTAAEALPGWADGPLGGGWATPQVFVWDRDGTGDATAPVTLVSEVSGIPSLAGATDPVISADGRAVVFVTVDQGLVPADYPTCHGVCPAQIVRHDRDPDGNRIYDEPTRRSTLTLVSGAVRGEGAARRLVAGRASSWSPAVTADGSAVVFTTDAHELVPLRRPGGGGPSDGEIVMVDVLTGHRRAVTDLADRAAGGGGGRAVAAAHGRPAVSETGRTVVFDSVAADAITGEPTQRGRRHLVAIHSAPTVDVPSVDFGTTLVGAESEELYVSVYNHGPGSFRPAEVTVSSDRFTVTGGTCTVSVFVAAGEVCTVYLTYRPTGSQPLEAELRVSEAAGTAEPVTATGSVRGSTGTPALRLTPAGTHLGPIRVGEAVRRSIDVTNIGYRPVRIGAPVIDGVDADDFAVVESSCTGDRWVNPRATCNVIVEFRPTASSRRSALVTVQTTNGSYATAVLSGDGLLEPVLRTTAAEVVLGGEIGVGGAGFVPGSSVRLRYDDEPGTIATAIANQDGVFLVPVVVPELRRPGPVRIVASGDGGAVATVDVVARAALDVSALWVTTIR